MFFRGYPTGAAALQLHRPALCNARHLASSLSSSPLRCRPQGSVAKADAGSGAGAGSRPGTIRRHFASHPRSAPTCMPQQGHSHRAERAGHLWTRRPQARRRRCRCVGAAGGGTAHERGRNTQSLDSLKRARASRQRRAGGASPSSRGHKLLLSVLRSASPPTVLGPSPTSPRALNPRRPSASCSQSYSLFWRKACGGREAEHGGR